MQKTRLVSMTIIGRKMHWPVHLGLDVETLPIIREATMRFRRKYINYPSKIYMSEPIYFKIMGEMDFIHNVGPSKGGRRQLMGMDLIISKTKGMRIAGPDAFNPQYSYRYQMP